MGEAGIGAGLAALAFWGFLAAVVVAGIWYDLRRRQAQQETLRRIVESGQHLDEDVLDKLLSRSGGSGAEQARDLKVSGIITLSVAPGLLLLGWVLGRAVAEVLLPVMTGVAGLVGCIGLGLLSAAYIAARADGGPGFNRPEV